MNKHIDAAVKEGLKLSEESGLRLAGVYTFEAYDADGNLKWRKDFPNLVTDEGEDYMLNAGLGGVAAIGTWYVGLTDSAPTTAEADTMGSHAGWTEITDYDEAARPAADFSGTVPTSSQSIDNSGAKASYSINASVTVGGAFLVSDNTKGGSTGTLYSVGAFTGGDKSGLTSGDTLNVTYTATAGGA